MAPNISFPFHLRQPERNWGGLDNKRSTTFTFQSQKLLVLIIVEEEAVGPDQLSLVSKLNGCRLHEYETWVLAPGFQLKWQKYEFFQPILFSSFPLQAPHNSQVSVRDHPWSTWRLAGKCSSDGFSTWPIYPFLHIFTLHPCEVASCSETSHKHRREKLSTGAQKTIRWERQMRFLARLSIFLGLSSKINQESQKNC